MAERKRSATPEAVDHSEQWRAAQASRRETLPEIVVVHQAWSRRRTATLVGAGILVGVVLGVGGLLTASATAPAPPTATSVVIVLEFTATPTLPPSPTPSPSPTMTSTPTITLPPSSTATRSPTVTPTPTPPAPVAIIKARVLNVRAGPGIDYDIVGYAALDQRYRIVDRNENGSWLRIDFDGLVGWVSAGWVQVPSGVEDLPRWADP